MTMDKKFRAGVALGFSSRLQQNAKISASEAIRRSQDAMELNKAIFTPCEICAPETAPDAGTPHEPTWSIQAAQVIQDHKRQLVYYKHVVIRVKGFPVMALPVFWHADPQAVRKSGLLAPKISLDSRKGLSFEQPYLWVISPSQDLVLAPMINTKVNPYLEGEYRKRFYSGQIDARFGYGYDQQFDSDGRKYDNLTSRSYVLAQGAFAPTDNWVYGFSAERVTDPLLFERYNIANVFDQQRGLYAADDQRLISQAYAVEQDTKSYVSIAAMSFQGLRPTDLNGEFPFVGPLIEAHYEPDVAILGGRLRLLGDGVLLNRDRSVTTDTPPGVDSRRATAQADWNSSFTLSNGIRLQPFANARADVYNVADLTPTDTADRTTTRVLGTAGVDVSWPFFKREGDMTIVLEPLAQVAISPDIKPDPNIPNEDSVVFNLDETTLFDANKSPGFDIYEGGQRLNVGGRATFRWDAGGSAQFLVGRSLRARADPSLPAYTSLNQTVSDWVLAASFAPIPQFSAFSRALVDDHGEIARLEAGMDFSTKASSGFVRYLRDVADETGLRTENFQAGGQTIIYKHWGVIGSANWDIADGVWVRQELGLLYQDDCTHLEIVYQHDGTFNRTQRPSDKIVVRLMLATLGVTGYQRSDSR
jgi:LPS-assembly protein